jgi:plastocyanin
MLAAAAASGGPAAADTIRVAAKGLGFNPAAVTAHVGDTVEWVNDDFVAHTATARNGAWDVMLAPHATGQTVLKTPGKVAYYCRFHPNMKGEITVIPK